MAETRNTNQRMKILQYLKGVCSHPTAEEVYTHVKKDMPAITLATVYRNLNLLAERGEILRLEIDHEYRYDACCNSHIHYVCKDTGKIQDIEDKKILEFVNKKAPKGFKTESVTIIVKGTCK